IAAVQDAIGIAQAEKAVECLEGNERRADRGLDVAAQRVHVGVNGASPIALLRTLAVAHTEVLPERHAGIPVPGRFGVQLVRCGRGKGPMMFVTLEGPVGQGMAWQEGAIAGYLAGIASREQRGELALLRLAMDFPHVAFPDERA